MREQDAPPPPPDIAALIRATNCGERSDSERSEGIRVRGRSREPELVDKPPHPICFASPWLRSQIDLSPQAGRGGASGALPPPSSEPYAIALPRAGRGRIPSAAKESG